MIFLSLLENQRYSDNDLDRRLGTDLIGCHRTIPGRRGRPGPPARLQPARHRGQARRLARMRRAEGLAAGAETG